MPLPVKVPAPNRSWYTSETAVEYGSMPAAVARDDPPLARLEARPVERVGQRPDQALGRLVRQLRVEIQGDDETHGGQRTRIGAAHRVARGPVPAQQMVKLRELAALALPAHPAALHRVPHAPPMQQEKARRPAGRV